MNEGPCRNQKVLAYRRRTKTFRLRHIWVRRDFQAIFLLVASCTQEALSASPIGGEAPGAWVFVAEHARQGRVGFAVGLLTAGLSCGILLGSIVAVYTNVTFSQTEIKAGIWRLPFLLGGVLGFVATLLRRWLAETPVFEEMRRHATAARELPIRTVLRNFWPIVARGALSTWMLTASIVVVILMSPSLLENLFHIPPRSAVQANLSGCAALCFSVLAVGTATDRFGIRRVSIIMSTMLILGVYALFAGAERAPSALIGFHIFAGIGAGCAVLAPIVLVAAFPPAFRFTGVSVSYNIAYAVFGGLTPIVVSWLAHLSPLAAAHYVAVASIAGAASIAIGAKTERHDDKATVVSASVWEMEQ
jgi:MFS family permease